MSKFRPRFRRFKRHAATKSAGASPLVIEALEPRQLLSATVLRGPQAQNIAQAMHDNLAHFETVLASLEHSGIFAHSLPMIAGQSGNGSATLGDMVKLSSMLDADVVSPVNAFVQQLASGAKTAPADSAALATDLANVINAALGSDGTASVTDSSAGGNVDLHFSLSIHSTENFALTIGDKANVALTFPTDLQGTASIGVNGLGFETIFAANSKVLTDSTAQAAGSADLLDGFTLASVAADVTLGVSATIPNGHEIDAGLLTLDTTAPATLHYNGAYHVDLAGTVSGSTLNSDAAAGNAGSTDFLTGLAEVSLTSDPLLTLAIPVQMASVDKAVPGLGAGFTGTIGLTGNVFDGNWSAQVTGAGVSVSVLHDFAALSPAKIAAEFQALDGYFSGLTGSSLTDATIPFTNGTTLGQVLDFAHAFQTDVVDKLTPVNSLLGFTQGQSSVAADGAGVAHMVITPTDLSTSPLPASFNIDITADGHSATLNLSNQYTDAQGNLHTITSVDDLVNEINTQLDSAQAGTQMAALAASLSVLAVNGESETLALSGDVVTLGGTVTSGDVVQLQVTNSLGLASGPVTVSVTTKTTDTLTTIATSLANAIDANATLAAAGITATVSGDQITVVTAANSGTTSLAVPHNALELSAVASGSDQAPASLELTAPNASFNSLASLAVNLGQALGLGSDISNVANFISGLGFSYDSTLNAIEFNLNYTTSVSLGSHPTETLTADSAGTTLTIGGLASPGDTLDVVVANPHLPDNSVTIAYTVQSSDTLDSITTGLIGAINGNADIVAAGLSAAAGTASDSLVLSHTASTDSSAIAVSGGANGAISFAAGVNLGNLASLSGSGDLSLTASIAASLTIGFNLDPLGAQANGVQMTVDGAPLGVATNLFHAPVWTVGTAATPLAAITADQLSGTTGLADMQLTLRDGTTGTIEVQHGEIIDVIGGGAPVVIAGSGSDPTALNIQGAVAAGDVVDVTISYGTSSTEMVSYTAKAGDTLSGVASGLAAAINADALLQAAGITAGAAANTLALHAASGSATLGSPTTTGHESFDQQAVTIGDLLTAFDDFKTGTVDVTISGVPNTGMLDVSVGGSTGAGDMVDMVITSPVLAAPVVVQHQVLAGDTLADTAQALASLIDANPALVAAGVHATYSSGESFTLAGNATVSTDPQSLSLATQSTGDLVVQGSVTAGDVVSVTLSGGALGNVSEVVSYTVQHGDTLADIAAGLQAAIAGDDVLSAAGVSATINAGTPDALLLSGGVSAAANSYSSAITANGSGDLTLSGTPSAGEVVALSVTPNGGGATETAAYTVHSGDSADDVIAKLADAINLVDSSVSASVEAVVTGADSISVTNDPYLVDHGDAISLAVDPLPGDVLRLAVDGHVLDVTVRAGYSSSEDVIAAIVDAINNAGLSGVSADLSAQITGATLGTVAAPTESAVFQTDPSFSVTTSGTAQVGDVLALSVSTSGSGAVTDIAATALGDGQSAAYGLASLADAVNGLGLGGVSASVTAEVTGASLSVPVGETHLTDTGQSIDVTTGASGVISLDVGGHIVTYSSQVGESTADIIAGLVDAVNTAGISGVSATMTMSVDGAHAVTSAPAVTETLDTVQALATGPAVGTGDVLSLTFQSNNLPGAIDHSLSLGYTVQSTDTLATIAAALAAEIHADATLTAAGIDATIDPSNPDVIVITGNPSVTTNPGSLSLSVDSNGGLHLSGTPSAGDVLAIGVTLSGGSTLSASYVAQSTDSQADVIAKVADAIDAIAPSVTATVEGTVSGVDTLSVWDHSADNTADLHVTGSGIEVLAAHPGDLLTLDVNGQEVSYTVLAGHISAQDVVAGLVDAINNAGISGVSAALSVSVSNATLTVPASSGETLAVTPGAGGVTAVYDTSTMSIHLFDGTTPSGTTPASLGFVNGTTAAAAQLSVAPPDALSSSAYYQALIIAAPTTQVDYAAGNDFLLTLGGLTPVEVSIAADSARANATDFAAAVNAALARLSVDPTAIGLDPAMVVSLPTGQSAGHAGDTVSLDVHNSSLTGGSETITYTVQSGDSAAAIATGLADAVNADTALQAAGIAASVSGATISVATNSGTSTLSGAASTTGESLAAETIPYSDLVAATGQAFTVEGAATAGNVITLKVDDNGTNTTVSYTVVAGDSAASIASALAAKIGAISDLSATTNGASVVYSSNAGNSVLVTDQSAAGNSEFVVSSLVFATTMYREVSASANNMTEAQAAAYGLSITPVDTTLSALNGSHLVSELGFAGTDSATLNSPVGEIDSGALYSTTIADRFFFNNTAIVADLTLTLSNLDLQGALGFIGFDAQGHGSLELEAALRLQAPDGNNYVTFHELQTALGNDALSSFFSFTVGAPVPGQAWAQLSIDSIVLTGGNEAGSVIADLANALVSPSIDITFNSSLNSLSDFIHARPEVSVSGFDNIAQMQHLSAADVLAGLQTVLQVISNDTGAQILNADIPIIGVSIGSLLNYAQDFTSFLTNLQSDPSGTVAQLNTAIQDALGSYGSDVNLAFTNGALMLSLTFKDGVNETLPFSLDLATLAQDAGITLPSEITSIVGASGNGDLAVSASAMLGVSIGIQLQAPAATLTTPLLDVNNGKGITTNGTSAPDIVITTGGGRQFGVDLNAIATTTTASVDSGAGTITLGGTITTGETVTVTLDNTTLDNGKAAGSGAVSVTYTINPNDTPADIANALAQAISGSDTLKTGGITAKVSGDVVTIAGAGSIATKLGGNVQELLNVINDAAAAAGAGSDFASLASDGSITFTDSATSAAPSQDAAALGFTAAVDVAGAHTVTASATGGLSAVVANDNVSVSGTLAAGDQVTITVNGQDATYTVLAGDHLSDVDQKLADAINLLKLNGVSATLGGQVATAQTGAAETLGGSVTAGDKLSLTVDYGGHSETVSYTAIVGDTLATEAGGLAAAINADTALSGAGVSAVATGDAVMAVGDGATLSGSATATTGSATETMTAGAIELAAGTAPASFSAGDSITLMIDGQAETLTIGANDARATNADLAAAINQALAFTIVDGGVISASAAGTQVALSTMVGAVVDGSGIAFVGADSVLGATPALAVASPAPLPLGIAALGFSGTTDATDTGGISTLTTTLPATIDYARAYEFQMVVNGQAGTISLAADAARTTDAAFVRALDIALGSTFIDQQAAGLGGAGKALLGSLVTLAESDSAGTITLTFTAPDAHLGASHALSIQDVASNSQATLQVYDVNGGSAAESLGFATGAQSVTAAPATARVLSATALTDNANNHRFFIDTVNTGLTLTLGAAVTNLNFSTNIGPLAVSIQNGLAVLGAETLVNGALPAAGDPNFLVSTDVANNAGTLHFGLTDGLTLNEQHDPLATADRLYFSEIHNVSQEQTVRIGGSATAGDVVSLTIANAKTSAPETVDYTVATGNDPAAIAAALVSAINADATLIAAGITAAAGSNGTFQVYGAATITDAIAGVGSHAATENAHIATGYGNLLEVTSNMAVQVSLPIYFLGVALSPVVSIEIGNVLGGPSGWALDAQPWTLSIPNLTNLTSQLAASFNVFSFLNNPEAVINGLNGLLGALDTLFTQQVFGLQLPLIGGVLADAGDFIGAMRATLIGDLNGLVSDYMTSHNGAQPTTADIVQSGVNEMTAALGFSGGITVTVDAPNKTIDFVLDLSKDLFNGTVNLSGNLGIPGLGISVQNGAVGLDLNTTIHLAFDYVQGVGFSMMDSTAGQHAVALNFSVTIPHNFSVGLTLGILTLTGTNGATLFTNADNTTATGTSLAGGVFVDLHPKTNNDLADLGSTSTLIAATDAGGTQTVSLTMPDNVDVAAAYNFDVVINGTAVVVSVAADPHRTTEADLVQAINAVLDNVKIANSVVDSNAASGTTETLAALGVSASLSGHVLNIAVADAKLGSGGTLAMSDVAIPFTKIGQNIRVEVAANLDLDLQLQATLFGGNMALPSISTELLFAYQFDKVLVGTDVNAVSGVIMPFTFKDVTLDMGQFLSGFLEPILSAAEKIIQPIMPILNFVTSPLPGISTLLGQPISILNLMQIFGQADPKYAKDIADVTKVITTVNEVATLINAIQALAAANHGEVMLDFGTFTFGKATVGPLATAPAPGGATSAGSGGFDPFNGGSLQSYQLNTSALSTMAPTTNGNDPRTGAALGQLSVVQSSGGITLTLLHDPMDALQLLMGQTSKPVTLFEWNLPSITLTAGFQQEFPVASIGIISVNAILGASVSLSVHVVIGYDTLGISEFVSTHNPVFILDGFFVDDTQGPQLSASVSVTLGVSVSIPIVEVGITGTIGGDLNLQLYDASGTGKVRFAAILSELETGDPLNLFVVSGDIYAQVDVFVWVGIHIPLIGRITFFSWDQTLVHATLVSFVLTPPQHPILATAASDGTVTLNMGELSSQRDVGNTSPTSQTFTISNAGSGNITIGFDGASQTIHASRIVADTGSGNSDITLHDLTIPITITGGAGNNLVDASGSTDGVFTFGNGNNTIIGTNASDTITVGNGDNTIIDGSGGNLITVGNGDNYIASGSGNDVIIAGIGNNVIIGGAGNNTITVGSGNNIVIGGQATSVASTFVHGGTTFTVYGPDGSGVVSNAGASGDGNNVVNLGTGNNIVLAGSGSDQVTLDGGGDNFVIADLGSVALATGSGGALSNWQSNGPAAVVSITASTAAGGNDVVNGQTSFGDNVILGGAGNDTLEGGAGTNIILGDDGSVDGPAGGSGGHFSIAANSTATGNDLIVGGAGVDVLIGGPGNDQISGGAGNDLVAGGDATVVRTAALGASANLYTMTALPDGSSGSDSIDGGSGNNVILGGGGATTISGGSGHEIILGDYGTVDASSGTNIIVTGVVDTLGGSDGADIITAGDGNSVIMGGGGADTMSAGNGNDVFFGDAGQATLTTSDYSLVLAHTVNESFGGNDTITISGTGNNVVFGGAGSDSISVTGTGNNVVLGGLGSVSESSTQVIVSSHNIASDSGNANYLDADIITVGAAATGSNVVMGGAGADTLSVNASGNNVVLGDSGTATLTVGSGNSLTPDYVTTNSGVHGGEESIGGNDTITINGDGNNVVMGGAGADTIDVLGTGNNVVLGDLGSVLLSSTQLIVQSHDIASDTGNATYSANDVITVGASATGSNVVMGGAGADTLSVNASGNNVVLGDSGTATLSVGSGNSLTPDYVTTDSGVNGGEESIGGNDTITINGDGNNIVMGGAGADTIDVLGTGNNVVLGDLGSVLLSSTQLIVQSHDLASDTGNATYSANDVITVGASATGSNVVMGGAGADTLSVNASGNNVVLGDSGTATLTVGSGNSLTPDYVTTDSGVNGGEESIGGNDTITINGDGNNIVMGGAGADTIDVLGTGNNVVLGDLGSVLLSSTQLIVQSHDTASDTGNATYSANDVITVGASATGSNVVMGGAGADTLSVNASGNNVVLGDSGTATLTVGSGNSLTPDYVTTDSGVNGGEESIGGNDTIAINGNGNNVVMGGAGADTIDVLGTGNNMVLGDLGSVLFTVGQVLVQSHDTASDTGNTTYSANDVITVGASASGSNVVMGGAGNDTITINATGNNVALGDSGTATLSVGSGGSLLTSYVTTKSGVTGGEESIGGNDTITVNGNGNNVVMGGAGADTLTINGTGNNVVLGDLGSVQFLGTSATVQSHDAASDTGNSAYVSNDVITIAGSGNGSNIVMGGAGNDTIDVAANGNNYVLGDSGVAAVSVDAQGAFLLQSITTQDQLTGGEESIGGNDIITITGNGDNAVLGGAGADTITLDGTGNNVVMGDLGSVTLGTTLVADSHDTASDTGNATYSANDVITLGTHASGTNIVMGGAGADLITQNGPGIADILGDSGQAEFTNWATTPVLQLFTTVSTINGGEETIGGNDTIDVNGGGNNVVMAGAGQDTIIVTGGGNNSLLGDLGQLTPVTVEGIAGYDLLGHNTRYGDGNNAWNDTITLALGASGDNTIMGGAGADIITVFAAGLFTHSGDNIIFGDSGEVNPVMVQTVDEVSGGADTITIGQLAGGDNTILGGAGQDVITVLGAGDNSVLGDMGMVVAVNGVTPDIIGRHTAIGGNDTIAIGLGANGNNVVMGEAGDDIITSSGNGLNVLLGDTGLVTHQQIRDRLYPQTVQSTDIGLGGNDTIYATQGSNVMIGGTGADSIGGGSGNDYILGDDGTVQFTADVARTDTPVTMYSTNFNDGGNDVISTGGGAFNYAIGGTGADTMAGGSGADLLAGDQALINWNSDGTRSYFTTVDSQPTGSSADIIIGNGGNNDILGGEGADTLTGGPDSNIIMGDGGHIYFRNNKEVVAETLDSFSPGADTIIGGGEGHNFLFGGGPDNNFFVADPLSDMIFNTDGRVDITDQRTGEWSMPPFLGNPVTSMVGNWLPGVTEGFVGGVGVIVANEYYTEPTVMGRLDGIEIMKLDAPPTSALPQMQLPSLPDAPADLVLFDNGFSLGPFDHPGDGAPDPFGGDYQPADSLLMVADGGSGHDAARIDHATTAADDSTMIAYIFDSNSGFWVLDESGPQTIHLGAVEEAAGSMSVDWGDGVRIAA